VPALAFNYSRKLPKPWTFLALTFTWSWLFLVIAVLLKQPADALPIVILRVLSGIGPMLAAILLLYIPKNVTIRKEYWHRLLSFKRISSPWYLVIFLFPPILTGLSAIFDLALGGDSIALEAASEFTSNPLTIFPYIVFILFFGPVPEEMGWRGYALDGLQARFSALIASLILGGAWSLWHLPLFFLEGTYQANLGIGSLSFWLYLIVILPQAILITWIFNNNRRSTLSAVLFHFMINFTGELFALSQRAEIFLILLWILSSLLIVIVWGPQHLIREKRGQHQ
jgi:membrane protease YdiL (CAAX protease family)